MLLSTSLLGGLSVGRMLNMNECVSQTTHVNFGGIFADFDNDGLKDLYVTNGIRRDVNNKDFYNENRAFFDKM